jgi:hypothetical protein
MAMRLPMKLVFLSFLLVLSLSTFAQKEATQPSKKELEKRMQDSIAKINDIAKKIAETRAKTEKIEEKVLNFYVRVISKSSEAKYVSDASYRKDGTKFNLDNFEEAKEFLNHFVSTQDDTNFSKSRAYKTLAWIAIEEKNFMQAKTYIDESERIQYIYYCGNEPESEKKKVKKMYDLCAKGLAQFEQK